nr:hypothetical protein [Tanacetum cinerariifolium]
IENHGKDLVAGDEGLIAGDEGPNMRVESHGLEDEGHRVESDGHFLRDEGEDVPEGQQQAALVVGTAASAPLGLGTARMAVRVPPTMSPDLSAGIAEEAAMSDSAFCKMFRSSNDSLPSPTLLVWKRYRGTTELILDTNSEEDEEVEESLDSDSVSEDTEDEGPTLENKDLVTGDEGLIAGDEGPDMRVESHGLEDEGHRVESDGHFLREEGEAVPEGQQQAALVVGTAASAPLGLGYGC